MNCYIVGAGEFHGELTPKASDIVIAADGGIDSLATRGITPDFLIGDLDSVNDSYKEMKTHVFSVRKNETDTYLCYLEGKRLGYSRFLIYGGTGGREDHTFANYQLLYGMSKEDCLGILIGNNVFSLALTDSCVKLILPPEVTVSVFAIGGEAEGVCIKGLSYECDNINLSPSFPLGVSNSTPSDEAKCQAEISASHGSLLIMVNTSFKEDFIEKISKI